MDKMCDVSNVLKLLNLALVFGSSIVPTVAYLE